MGQCLNEGATLCSLYFIVFYVAIVRFDSFNRIVTGLVFTVMFTFSLKELTPQTVLRFGQNNFKIDFKIDFKFVCGRDCVSAPNPSVPFSRSLKESSLRSNLWFGLRFSRES